MTAINELMMKENSKYRDTIMDNTADMMSRKTQEMHHRHDEPSYKSFI
jgi:hypothetical protein